MFPELHRNAVITTRPTPNRGGVRPVRRNPRRSIERAACSAVEPLETRVLMSTINWSNKGTGPGINDTDSFNAIYGANATLARSIVQRAVDDWERVITNFNGFAGRNTFTLTLNAASLGAGVAGSTSAIAYDGLLKPQSATINMDDDAAGNGWYFDPTPGSSTLPEDSEFTSFITPFAADRTTSSGRDLYRSTVHELAHAMGISATAALVTALETDVGDDPNSANAADRLMGVDVNGDSVDDYTLTTSGGRHFFEGGGAYTGPVHPNEIINPGRAVSSTQVRRGLISDNVAQFLDDIFGYTIQLPSTINTFYAQYNQGANSVTINGDMDTDGSDVDFIDIETAGTAQRFEVNGTSETIEGVNFAGIIVNALEAGDDVDVDNLLAGKTLTVNGGNGNDLIQLAPQTGDIDNDLLSNVTVNGGAGTDTVQANDTNDPVGADTYTITSPSVTFGSRVVNHLLCETFELLGSREPSVYNINSYVINSTLEILASGFADTFNVGDGDYDSHIFGDIDIDGQNGGDVLNITDDADTTTNPYTLTNTSFTKTAGGTTSFTSIETCTLDANDQGTLINVDLNGPMTTTINAGPGNDTLDLGAASDDLDNAMAGDITFNGQNGTDKVDLNDAGDSADSESYTLTFESLSKSSAAGTLTYNGTEQVDLRANDGANTITVEFGDLLASQSVTVGGGGGDDVITSLVPGTVSLLEGDVTLQGGAGTDSIILDDSAGSLASAYNLTSDTFQASGVGFTSGLITYTSESVDIDTSAIPAVILIPSTAAGTGYVVRGNDGDDTFEVGFGGNADAVDGALDIRGNTGTDTFNYRDGANALAHTYTVTSTTVARDGAATVTYGGMEALVAEAGASADTIAVNSTLATTPVTVNGNGGSDALAVGGGDWDDNLLANVTFNGEAGAADSISIDDTSDAVAPADNYTVASGQSSKSSTLVTISYGTAESYTLDASGSANTITVNSSFPAPFRVNGNGGADTVNVLSSAAGSFITVDGGAGLDNVNVNSDGAGAAEAHFDTTQDLASLTTFAGGTAVMEANGGRVIDTDALTIAANSKLDLSDNDLILDYSGASQLGVVQALINLARNGGAWNVNGGITSSSAGANAADNTTLGAMEASEYKSIYGAGATFDGRTIDNSAVLVKYTYYGDADFSGGVDFDDYVRTDAGFNNGFGGWVNGDTDGSGGVDFDDYVLIDLGFNTQGAAL